MHTEHFRACSLCEAMCGVAIDADDGVVTKIRGDAGDPFSRGYLCPKAVALKDVQEDPDRLRTPVRRDGASWRSIGWNEAYDLVARRLHAVQRAHGDDAVAIYLGNPSVHSYGSMLFAAPFIRSLHTKNRFSATSVDQLPHSVAAYFMFGHQLMFPIPDVDRTSHFLVFGANPVASNGSLMTAPGMPRRLEALRARGGKLVVVDPRRTETAQVADRHHFVRPGTDVLVLLGMVNTLLTEDRVSLGRLASFTRGLERLREAMAPWSPERVAGATGLSAEEIRTLARELASATSGVAYGRVGISTQPYGTLSAWLVTVANILTGNLDRPGGAMFTTPALDALRFASKGSFGRWRSRVRGLSEFSGELPAATLAEEIDTPGRGQIRALVTSAGNPVLSTPNGGRLDRALAGLEFMASIDFYVNETTRHAHVILPPTPPLEHDHYDVIFHALAIRNTAKYSPAVFPKRDDARHDYEIMSELTWRMAGRTPLGRLRERARALAMQRLGPRGIADMVLRIGPRGDKFVPFGRGLSMERVERSVHGIDLGPLEPCLPSRLFTKDRTIELAPPPIMADLARVEELLAPRAADGGSLELIGRRQLRSNNSWMHNSLRLVKGRPRCTLLIHPSDASARGLTSGGLARVTSRVGSVVVPVELTDEMMPGVVSLPHGWGHDRGRVQLAVAREHAGASLNDLTDEARVDALSGNAVLNGVQVEVTAASAR